MTECIYRMAAWACDPAAYSKVKSEVSVQITSRTKARRAEAHKEFNESEVLQSGDKPAVCQSHFFTHLRGLKLASCYRALPGDVSLFFSFTGPKNATSRTFPQQNDHVQKSRHPCQAAWNIETPHLITLHLFGCKTSINSVIYSFTQTGTFTCYIVSASSNPGTAICSPL